MRRRPKPWTHARWSGDSSDWTNLSTFRGHGGKLIFLHGVSDPWFSAQETVRYYELLGRDNAEAPLRRVEPPVPRARHGPLRRRRAHARPVRHAERRHLTAEAHARSP